MTPVSPEINPELKRLDTHPIPDDRSEIRLFAVMRNEMLRLPYFLDYYRRAGVKRFFIIDNDSNDGGVDYLLTQTDCAVFHTRVSYATRRFGVDWQNALLDVYGVGHWIVLADADELLVYPHCEMKKLPELCSWFDAHGYEGIFAILLDMYSNLPLRQVNYKVGEDFLSACAYFDKDYYFVRRPYLPVLRPAFPTHEPIGGPRLRICFPEQNVPGMWPRLRAKLWRRALGTLHGWGILKGVDGTSVAPQAFKMPLVKWRRGYAYVTSHRLNRIRLGMTQGAMLHFKYFQDFSARVQDAVDRNIHYDGSAEYKRYARRMLQNPDMTMTYEGSTLYRDSGDLVRCGIIRTNPAWERS
jgi:hypothetical protein